VSKSMSWWIKSKHWWINKWKKIWR
jgi:hypothetical protein